MSQKQLLLTNVQEDWAETYAKPNTVADNRKLERHDQITSTPKGNSQTLTQIVNC